MSTNESVPPWLWRFAIWGFGLSLISLAALALALANGLADPPRAGPLLWQDDFKNDVSRWQFIATPGASLQRQAGALVATFTDSAQSVVAVTEAPATDFTLEIAAAQTEGAIGAQYGLVLGWRGEGDYTAVLLNGNGYATAYGVAAGQRRDWFPFQQWPHILYGAEANRVQIHVQAERITARINDERLIEFAGDGSGKLGVMAQSAGAGRVVVSWVKVWAAAR
jgi:hypothetical protein